MPVRCRFLNTPINDAYQNVVLRILERYGRLVGITPGASLVRDLLAAYWIIRMSVELELFDHAGRGPWLREHIDRVACAFGAP